MIAGIGLPYAYDHFSEEEAPEAPPFICFLYPDRVDFIADNINYQPITRLVIELYSDNVDFDHEAEIEAALTSAELPFTCSREWLEDEKMYMTTYDTEVSL